MTSAASTAEPSGGSPRLAVLKALGDNTRYAIYLELARSAQPLTTAQVAETLGLHPNTVRPHLERMREVGLLEVHIQARGTPGRPQHRYAPAVDAPSLGLEPPTFPVLARMLLQMAGTARLTSADAADAGREQGATDARRVAGHNRGSGVDALVTRLDELGFDPVTVEDGTETTVAFLHCPFRDLAETDPEVVCGLHRGLVEGFTEACGDSRVTAFHTLVDHTPCQVALVPTAYPPAS